MEMLQVVESAVIVLCLIDINKNDDKLKIMGTSYSV
jgi:hypothetical protein